ncbi:hypothetical protein NPIL_259381, partial [Nephila pilipes]
LQGGINSQTFCNENKRKIETVHTVVYLLLLESIKIDEKTGMIARSTKGKDGTSFVILRGEVLAS